MTSYHIDFQPLGRRGVCSEKQSLLRCAQQCGIGMATICGGKGTCHSCRVQVLSGSVSAPTSSEIEAFSQQELQDGWRLACQVYSLSNSKVSLPTESMTTPQRTQVEGQEIAVRLEPAVRACQLQLPTPMLSEPQADADRLLQTLNQQHCLHCSKIDIDVLRTIPSRLRAWNWQCQATVSNDEVIALGPRSSRQLGLAIDVGTTKVAGYLVDLSNGQTLAAKGMMNPQVSHSEDIISRITAVMNSSDVGVQLQRLIVEALNEMAVGLCDEVGAETEEIVEAVAVGNTAMHHLMLHLPVGQLATPPFLPAVSMPQDIKARSIGLHLAPGASVHLLPNIAGFVGADHVGMLLATDVGQAKGLSVALDIGTNTEVSLVNNGEITTVSCASGPAFEGGHIKDGVRAASGAIERLQIANDSIQYQTIDNAPPIGICGSGALDAIAQLYLAGIIDKGGKMKESHPLLRIRKKQREFVLVGEEEREGHPSIVITQKDIRELQLAKAAIRTGLEVLLETAGLSEKSIEQVIIAGAFGSYIDISSAIAIGMLPPLPSERFRQVGNAAGIGAKLALVSCSKRREAQTIASRVRYLELAASHLFMPTFIEASHLGRYLIRHGKRKDID
ncbi:ASKHA domain-containing protein [Chloroflexota bacterium]